MIIIKEFSAREHDEIVKPLIKIHFSQNSPHFDPNVIYDNQTVEALTNRRKKIEEILQWTRIAAYKNDKIIGWSIGKPYSEDSFIMANSLVLHSFRRQGIYLQLLEETISKVKAMGFKNIISNHLAANNAIIIAKLKAGFEISGVQVTDEVGVLINLTLNLQKTTPTSTESTCSYPYA